MEFGFCYLSDYHPEIHGGYPAWYARVLREWQRIDAMGFDAIITPSFSFGTSPAATSGYPSMAVPVGYTPDGRPVGLWLAASLLQEPTLIRIGYAIEQLLHARVAPTLAGSIPPDPTPFPGCDAIIAAAPSVAAQTAHMHMHPRHW
jgi:hypothetical protein